MRIVWKDQTLSPYAMAYGIRIRGIFIGIIGHSLPTVLPFVNQYDGNEILEMRIREDLMAVTGLTMESSVVEKKHADGA